MKNRWFVTTLPLLLAALLIGCGEEDKKSGEPAPAALVDQIRVSTAEESSGIYYANDYMENAVSYRFSDTDGDPRTSLTADGKRFVSAELNMSIVGGNLYFVAGNVGVTKTYTFGLVGTNGDEQSLELAASFEITDGADDAATVLKNIAVPATAGVLMPEFAVSATATDPDGMLWVSVALARSGTPVETRFAYPGTDPGRIDVNETFRAEGEGNYTVTLTAQGVTGGEGNRSLASASRSVDVSLFNDINDTLGEGEINTILDEIENRLLAIDGTLTPEEIAALLGDIGNALRDGTLTLSEGDITALIDDIGSTLGTVDGPLSEEVITTVLDDVNDTLSGAVGGLLDGLGL